MGGILGLCVALGCRWLDVDSRLYGVDDAMHDSFARLAPSGVPVEDPIVVVTVVRDESGRPVNREFDARVQGLTKLGATCIVDEGLPLGDDVGWVGRLVVAYDGTSGEASDVAAPAPPSLPIYGELPTPVEVARPTKWAPSARARLGVPFVIPDLDGVVRRMPLIARIDDIIVPNLAIAAGLSLYHESSLQFGDDGTTLLSFARVDVPLDRHGYQRLHFRGPLPQFKTLFLDETTPPEWNDIGPGNVVVFSFDETVQTPVDRAMTRGAVIATSLDNLMRGNTLRDESAWIEAIVQAAIGLLVGAAAFAGRHVVVTLLALTIAIGMASAFTYARFLEGVLFHISPTVSIAIVVVLGISLARAVRRRVRRPAALGSSREPSASE